MAAAPSTSVWRVGYRPEPLAWNGWEHATDGVFPGRWDDPDGRFRTIYVADSLLGCFLEVLAHARKEAYMEAALEEIHEDEEDAKQFPTLRPGQVHLSWLEPRCVATAVLYGNYCRVTAAGSSDEARMWAVFEQPHDPVISGHLTKLNEYSLETDNPDLLEAFRLLGLEWAE